MKIPLPIDCPELETIDTPPCPQTHVDLAGLEYRKAQLSPKQWQIAIAAYWAGFIHFTLKQSRN